MSLADEICKAHMGKANTMRVKLQEVLEALEGAGMETEYYYDTRRQEVLMVFDGMINGEDNPKLMEELSDGFIEDFIPLPGQYEINAYRMMENFIYALPDGNNKEALFQAIKGKGAFRRFKDRLYNFGMEQIWYAYRDACYENIAREWCEKHGIIIEGEKHHD